MGRLEEQSSDSEPEALSLVQGKEQLHLQRQKEVASRKLAIAAAKQRRRALSSKQQEEADKQAAASDQAVATAAAASEAAATAAAPAAGAAGRQADSRTAGAAAATIGDGNVKEEHVKREGEVEKRGDGVSADKGKKLSRRERKKMEEAAELQRLRRKQRKMEGSGGEAAAGIDEGATVLSEAASAKRKKVGRPSGKRKGENAEDVGESEDNEDGEDADEFLPMDVVMELVEKEGVAGGADLKRNGSLESGGSGEGKLRAAASGLLHSRKRRKGSVVREDGAMVVTSSGAHRRQQQQAHAAAQAALAFRSERLFGSHVRRADTALVAPHRL